MRMRTGHSKRIISVVIALSLVLSMMSGLSLSVSAAEAVSVSTWSQLKAALESTADVNITVTDNIDFTASDAATATGNCISITSGVKTLDLNGKGVSFMVDTFELMEVSSVPKQNHAPCLPHGDGGVHIAIEKKLLHPHGIRLVLLDQPVQPVINLHQTLLHGSLGAGGNRPVLMGNQPAAPALHKAVAANRRSRVYSQCQPHLTPFTKKNYSFKLIGK